MNVTQVYAIAAGGVFVLLLIVKSISSIQQVLSALAILMAKHLTYPFLLRRHRLLGSWSRADVLLQFIYFTINMFCMIFRVTSVKDAGARAGNLAMINMAPLFFGFHLSFLADILGISLSNYRRIHHMMGWMSFLLGLVHALAAIHGPSFLRDMPKNLYAVIVSRWIVPPFEHGNLYFIGRIFSWSTNAALSTGFPQAVVRVIPSESPSAGICVCVRSIAASQFEVLAGSDLSLYLYRHARPDFAPPTLQHSIPQR